VGTRQRRSAQETAQFRSPTAVYLDHSGLEESDLAWLGPLQRLTLWSVRLPPGLLAQLPRLSWLDIRGGSGTSLSIVEGCTHLRYLSINQVRGLQDLSTVGSMDNLIYVAVYGQPQLTRMPSFARLRQLRRADLGSLKGLRDISGLFAAPALEELVLMKMVRLSAADIDLLAGYKPLRRFTWFGEDVPDRVWVPVCDRLALPPAKLEFPEEWFRARGLPVP